MNEESKNLEAEVLLKYYEANRSAIISRIGWRDNCLMIYFGGVAAIFGAAIQSNNLILLMIIPFLALGFAALVSHHQYFINAHVWYAANEIGTNLKKLGIKAVQWESTLPGMSKEKWLKRSMVDAFNILSPVVISIALNLFGPRLNLWVLIFCLMCSCITLALIIKSHKFKVRINNKIEALN